MCIGTTDRNKSYHPFGIAVVNGETEDDYRFLFDSTKDSIQRVFGHNYQPFYLIADGAPAITNGFNLAFDRPEDDEQNQDRVRLMCWAHVIRNIDPKLDKLGPKLKAELREDIFAIQLSSNKEMFEASSSLFLEKWRAKESKSVNDFLKYFEAQWLKGSLTGWYEGAGPLLPSTNNALEATNRVIKTRIRTRLNIGVFLHSISDVLAEWSRERDPDKLNHKEFAEVLEFNENHPVFVSGFQWSHCTKAIYKINVDQEARYYAYNNPEKEKVNLSQETCKKFSERLQDQDWSDFDEFKNMTGALVEIKLYKGHYKSSTCSCSGFQKDYMCKHIVGLAYRYKLCDISDDAKHITIGQKRKRGRIPKTKKALLRQDGNLFIYLQQPLLKNL